MQPGRRQACSVLESLSSGVCACLVVDGLLPPNALGIIVVASSRALGAAAVGHVLHGQAGGGREEVSWGAEASGSLKCRSMQRGLPAPAASFAGQQRCMLCCPTLQRDAMVNAELCWAGLTCAPTTPVMPSMLARWGCMGPPPLCCMPPPLPCPPPLSCQLCRLSISAAMLASPPCWAPNPECMPFGTPGAMPGTAPGGERGLRGEVRGQQERKAGKWLCSSAAHT